MLSDLSEMSRYIILYSICLAGGARLSTLAIKTPSTSMAYFCGEPPRLVDFISQLEDLIVLWLALLVCIGAEIIGTQK